MTEQQTQPHLPSHGIPWWWLQIDRWLGYFFGLLLLAFLNLGAGKAILSSWWLWLSLVLTALHTLLASWSPNAGAKRQRTVFTLGFLAELVFINLLIFHTGGLESPFFLGYAFLLAHTALLVKSGEVFLYGAAAYFSYVITLMTLYRNLLFLGNSIFWVENILMVGLFARLLLISSLTHREAEVLRQAEAEVRRYAQGLALTNERLQALSCIDPLTGLFNSRYLQIQLKEEVERARREGSAVGLIFADIDDFRRYNELAGFVRGDEILRRIGMLINAYTRERDIVGRWGDDEFCIICPNIDANQLLDIADAIRRAVEEYRFEGEELLPSRNLTISVGVALFPMHAATANELIQKADDALYRMQLSSRNQVQMYSSILDELRLSFQDMESSGLLSSIQTLIMIINARDQYTYGHCERVAKYAAAIAEKMGLSPEEIQTLRYAGFLHDLGKIEIGREILNKRGPLTEEERRIVEEHPSYGVNIIGSLQSLASLAPAILHHHERYDGRGYPEGLQGEDIPLMARILAVADSFDAMMSHRPYGEAKNLREAIVELKRCEGTQFDPQVVKALLEILNEDGEKRQGESQAQ